MSVRTEFEKLYDPGTGGWFVPAHLRHPFDSSCIEPWRAKYPLNYAPVEMEVGQFYYSLVKILRPKLILETGTHFGYSSHCIADALKENDEDGILYTIDLTKEFHIFKGTEHEERIIFINDNSLEVDISIFSEKSRTLSPGGKPIFDMLILDADHKYGAIIGEIIRYSPHLRVGGVMLLHDSMYFDGIGIAVQQIAKTGFFDIVNLQTPRRHGIPNGRCPGLTIATKKIPFPEDFLTPDFLYMDVGDCLPGRTTLDSPIIGIG